MIKHDYLDSLVQFAGRRSPNIVLILVDCLRARNVGCCGSGFADTPHLDALGAHGFVFRKAFAQIPHTQPSTASILTSLYASVHGINTPENCFDPETIRAGEIFQAVSYDTAAFVANPHINRQSGHLEGIRYFSDGRSRTESANSRLVHWGEDSTVLNRHLFSWFRRERHPDKPFFLFLFYIDAHNPYTSLPNVFHRFLNRKLHYPNFMRYLYSDVEIEQIEQLYRRRIRLVDSSIGKLVNFLTSQNALDNTILVVTADHGDGIDRRPEHWLHGGLYEKGVHVPLIISAPWLSQPPQVFDHLVASIDILPSLLDLVDLPMPEQFQGQSFAPLLRGGVYEPRKYTAGEYNYNRYVRTAEWKYINNTIGILAANNRSNGEGSAGEEIYDPNNDPDEYKNLVNTVRPEVLESLRSFYEDFSQQLQQRAFHAETYKVDEEVLLRLRGLGYIE